MWLHWFRHRSGYGRESCQGVLTCHCSTCPIRQYSAGFHHRAYPDESIPRRWGVRRGGARTPGGVCGPAAANRRLIPGNPALPDIADTVTVKTTSGELIEGQFLGFVNRTTLTLQRLGRSQSGSLPLTKVATMASRQGTAVDGAKLREVMELGAIPNAVVLSEGIRRVVPLDSIAHLEEAIAVPRHGGRNGFIVGLALDVLWWTYFVYGLNYGK